MIRKFVVLLGALGIVVFFGAAIAVLGSMRPKPETVEPELVAPIAFVQQVEYAPMTLMVTTQGEVAPRREIILSAEIAGRIRSVSPSFANGGVFKAGETLLTIEDADFLLAVTRSKARVASAQQALAVEEAEAALAARDYKELAGENSDGPSVLALRKPQLAAAQADLAAAEADLADAELALKRTRIVAPFAGRVRSIEANVGQYVSPGARLGQVFATDVAEVRLPLSDQDLAKLNLPFAFEASDIEAAPRVHLSAVVAGAERQWTGYIKRIDAAIDSSTRQISAIAEIEDPYGAGADDGFPLAFGLFVGAEIEGPTIPRATMIPRLSMQDDGQVFIVTRDDTLDKRRPVIVAQAGEGLVATDGLDPGDLLVTSPVTSNVGTRVRPLYENGESASTRSAATASALTAADTGANL
ncbi:MAG: efflux RND transporter periplasmic adaptor subunit [Pseudomonadota bacterium]